MGLLLCYAGSCFFQQGISTLWHLNSSKHLLCPLILEPGPISSVYHPLLPLSHIIFVQHFANVLLWIEKKYLGVTFVHLVCIAIIFCSQFHLNLKLSLLPLPAC